ncbi:class I adenylate-forming enzyme family protein [Streptomyces sp. WG-D5]
MHIGEQLRRHADATPDRRAFTCGDDSFTWREADDRVNQLASWLVEQFDRGDRVAVFAFNCHRYFELYLACARAGMVCVPINSRLLASELAFILNDSEARVLFADGKLADVAQEAVALADHDMVAVGYGVHDLRFDYENVLTSCSRSPVDVGVRPTDLSVIAFTSGTTGRPKGAMQSHLACVLAAFAYALNMQLVREDKCLAAMPAYVYRGGSGGLAPVVAGAESVIAKFEAERVLDLIEKERLTHATLAPAMINLLLASPSIEKRDLSSLRALWTGGAPIRPETLQRLYDLVGDIVGAQYGMTESTGIAVINYRHDDTDRLRSVGRPTSLVDVRIVTTDGRDAGSGEVGEVWVKGDAVTSGYWRAPELDESVFDDGWFMTGDMAYRDADGYLYIVDRRIDIINSGGLNVYSLEVETTLAQHPKVAECAVIGVPDEVYGEAVMAIVVPTESESPTAAEICSWAREHLSGFKVPRHVEMADKLERNAMGKVDKRGLRERRWSGQTRMVNG